eukprot:scaffold3394_cov23-Cyclotella_meneghiniana.AAC.2
MGVDLVTQVEKTKSYVMFCDGLTEIKEKVDEVYAHFRNFYDVTLRDPMYYQDDGSRDGWGRRDGNNDESVDEDRSEGEDIGGDDDDDEFDDTDLEDSGGDDDGNDDGNGDDGNGNDDDGNDGDDTDNNDTEEDGNDGDDSNNNDTEEDREDEDREDEGSDVEEDSDEEEENSEDAEVVDDCGYGNPVVGTIECEHPFCTVTHSYCDGELNSCQCPCSYDGPIRPSRSTRSWLCEQHHPNFYGSDARSDWDSEMEEDPEEEE